MGGVQASHVLGGAGVGAAAGSVVPGVGTVVGGVAGGIGGALIDAFSSDHNGVSYIDPSTGNVGQGSFGHSSQQYQDLKARQQQIIDAYANDPNKTTEKWQAMQDQAHQLGDQIDTVHSRDNQDTFQYAQAAGEASHVGSPDFTKTGFDRTSLDPNAGIGDYMRYQQGAQSGGQVLNAVHDRALGLGGPSVAEQQLYAGRDAAEANALSIANSARGGNNMSATLAALNANAGTMQSTNQQAAMLRAQEQIGAQQTFGTMNNAQEGQDLAARQQTITQDLNNGQFNFNQNRYASDLANNENQFTTQQIAQQRDLNARREAMFTQAYQNQRNMDKDRTLGIEKQNVGEYDTAMGRAATGQAANNTIMANAGTAAIGAAGAYATQHATQGGGSGGGGSFNPGNYGGGYTTPAASAGLVTQNPYG